MRKLIQLRPREWAELLRAQVALLSAQIEVLARPVGSLVTDAALPADDIEAEPPPHNQKLAEAKQMALAVSRAASYGVFRPKCLVRAIALHRMLVARGLNQSRIRIGVRRRNGEFAAHAWVECGSLILGDHESHTSTFARLADLRPGGKR
ncbi:MAG: lasso peptide biosynthesis B2 protein [Gemmatimonadaceae bacterium]